MRKGTKKTILETTGLISLGLLAFSYLLISDFPIGDDPAIHIFTVKTSSYSQLFGTNYPLPLTIFKFLGPALHLTYQTLFIILICSFLFLSSVVMALLVKKITGSGVIGYLSGLIFVTGLWTYDGLRMGLMPEAFGWLILLTVLYFLVGRKFLLTLIFSGILVLSHPYSFTIYVLVFIIYAFFGLIFGGSKERSFVLKLLAAYLLIAAIAVVFKPNIVEKFIDFKNPEIIGWGERNFFTFFAASQVRRIYIAIVALIGIITTVKDWWKQGMSVAYILLIVGMFMAFNQIFGIRFQVFRFFPYFEMGLAIFGAMGIYNIASQFKFSKKITYLAIAALAVVVIAPQAKANLAVTKDQAHSVEGNNSMTVGDRKAIDWIGQNIPSNVPLAVPYKRFIWVRAFYPERSLQPDNSYCEDPFSDLSNIMLSDFYVYYPEICPTSNSVAANFPRVYDTDGVRIYEVRR